MTKLSYQHGGNPQLDRVRLNIHTETTIDFSVNISPLGAPEPILQNWATLAPFITSYPSPEGDGIKRFYQERHGLPSACVLAGNGATELLYLVPGALDLRRIAIIMPSFHDYERATHMAHTEMVPITLKADEDFAPLSISVLMEHLKHADAFWIGNPNNPTGTIWPADLIIELGRAAPDKWILIDQAFIDFLDDIDRYSLISEACLLPNIIVFHSLTKFYALPGLRLGSILSHPNTIDRLRSFKEPWSVNAIADKVAQWLIDCRDYETCLRHLISKERLRVSTHLKSINGLRVFEPTANFILAQWQLTDNLDDLLRNLLEKGLYVRDCRNFSGMEKNFFRCAIREPEDNDRLLNVFRSCTATLSA